VPAKGRKIKEKTRSNGRAGGAVVETSKRRATAAAATSLKDVCRAITKRVVKNALCWGIFKNIVANKQNIRVFAHVIVAPRPIRRRQ